MTTTTDLLSTLTDEQLAAVAAGAGSDGETIHVAAPPGSGKTRTIAARITYLIEEVGVDPEEICCLTFTRSAAAEIRERVAEAIGPALASHATLGTFHEVAIRLGPHRGDIEPASEIEVGSAIDTLYRGPTRRPMRELPSQRALERAIMMEAAAGTLKPGRDGKAVRLVANRIREAGWFPLFDVIREATEHPELRSFQHILVDESQDCTPAEIAFANRLTAAPWGTLYAVGDMAQAIMEWRGAAPDRWPSPTHRLTRSFRFGQQIAEVSNRLRTGEPVTPNPDVLSTVERIPFEEIDHREFGPELAILTRTRADSQMVADLYPERCRLVRRDPLDPLGSGADKLAEAREAGLTPIVTVHFAKGREWDRVLILGPTSMSRPWGEAEGAENEEQRVMYVAMTRARKELVLVNRMPERPVSDRWIPRGCGLL